MAAEINYPRVRALLVTLLGLEADDVRLPVDVLLRLNPAALAAPLRNSPGILGWEAGGRSSHDWIQAEQVQEALGRAYPELDQGGLFERDPRLLGLCDTNLLNTDPHVDDMWQVDEAAEASGTIAALVTLAGENWRAHDPLTWLYLTGIRRELAPHFAPILERELELHPDVLRMILDMARV